MGTNTRSAVERFASDRQAVLPPDEDTQEINWNEPKSGEHWRQAWKACRPHNRQDIMLDIIKDGGECFSFEYAYLNPIRFDGSDTLELDFGSYKVRIEGRMLKPLRRALKCHMVDYIQEGNESEDRFKPDSECHIDRISILEINSTKQEVNPKTS